MRALTRKGAMFNFNSQCRAEFEKCKELICSDVVVKPFVEELQTGVKVDTATTISMGWLLFQYSSYDEKTGVFEDFRLIRAGCRGCT